MASSPTARPPRPKRRDLHPSCRSGDHPPGSPEPCRVACRIALIDTSRVRGASMPHTVAEAAEAIGKSKAAVFRAIRKGKLSATRDGANGMFLIDPSELHRAFPAVAAVSPDSFPNTDSDVPRNGEVHARLADAHDQIQDLRRRLDQADTD